MSEVTPRDREEKLLAAIAEGATGKLPTPRNRKEKLLKEIYDNGGTGGGGGESTIAWRPTVDAEGNISWERTASTVKPATQNIMGPPGEKGDPGEANVIESISVNGVNVPIDENKNADITVPEAYDDTDIKAEIAKKANKEQFATTGGNSITVNDSVDGNIIDLKLYGKSEQKQYSGKNLLNPEWIPTKTENGVTVTNNGNNSWTFSGSITDNTKAFGFSTGFTKDTSPSQFHKAGYYTISVKGITLVAENQYAYVNLYYNGNPHYNFLHSSTKTTNRITEEMLAYDDFRVFSIGLYIGAGNTLKTGTVNVQIEYSETASETASEFEPYVGCVPSPNPEFPQEIKSVANPTVKTCGKNLIKPTCESNTKNGLTMTCNSDGSCTFNGTSTSTSNLVSYFFGIPNIVPGKKYKIVGCPSGGGWDKYAIGIDGHAIDPIGSAGDIGSGSSIFTPTKNDNAILFIWIKSGFVCNNLTFKPMIVDADLYPDATYNDYEPYKETTAALPYTLNAIPVESGGNVTIDGQQYISDYVDFEKKQLVRNVLDITFDGSSDEKWYISPSQDKSFNRVAALIEPSVVDVDIRSDIGVSCNIASLVHGGDLYVKPKGEEPNGFCIANQSKLYVHFSNSDATDDLSKWKEYLKTNNMRLLLLRVSPEIIDLTDEEVQAFKELSTYSSTTNVFVTSEQLNGYADVKYPTTDVSGIVSEHDTEIERLKNFTPNQFNTSSGKIIKIEDSVDGNIVELGVKGNSFQQTYSGKNLIPISGKYTKTVNGLTVTYDNETGIVSYSGTPTNSNAVCVFDFEKDFVIDTSKTYTLSKSNVSDVKVSIAKKQSTIHGQLNQNDLSVNLTLDDNIPNSLNVYLFGDESYVGTTISGNFKVQLRTDGISSFNDYEPYVGGIPSPNPDYPQTINSVGDDGNLVVTSCGKNVIKNSSSNTSTAGITFTKNSDGSISCTGTQTNHAYYNFNSDCNVDLKGKYILSGNTTTNGNEWGYCLFLQLLLEDGTYEYIFNTTPNEVVCDFSKYPTLKRVRPIIRVGANATPLTDKTVIFYPMLRPYGTDGTYEPYKESTTTIPLSEPLRAIGDVKDEITYQDGKCGVLRRIGNIVFDGSETWSASATRIGRYGSPIANIKPVTDGANIGKISLVKSDRFIQALNGTDAMNDGTIYVWSNAIQLNTTYESLESFKAWLASNHVTVNYELATPTFEPFADQSLPYLSTYDGVTNIFNDDALSAEMTVKYPTTDASGVGSKNEAKIAEIKGTIGNTDISGIGDGTVTGAISMMNSKLGGLTFSTSGTTLSITDGTNTWTLEANS